MNKLILHAIGNRAESTTRIPQLLRVEAAHREHKVGHKCRKEAKEVEARVKKHLAEQAAKAQSALDMDDDDDE